VLPRLRPLSYATPRLPLTRPCRYFAFLFGVQEADWYGAIDLATGKATVFVPRLPESCVKRTLPLLLLPLLLLLLLLLPRRAAADTTQPAPLLIYHCPT